MDGKGKGYASPDLFTVLPDRVVIVEVKLSQTPQAIFQLVDLYAPLLGHYFAKPVVTAIIFKNARIPETVLVDDLSEVIRGPLLERPVQWQLRT